MLKFKLEHFECKHQNNIIIVKITIENYKNYFHLIENTINYFKNEIKWDDMFEIENVIERLEQNMTLYLGLYDGDVYSHVWFKDDNDGKLLFNLFVRNDVIFKPYTGKEFVSNIINRYESNQNIYCNVDEWNEKSIKLFKSLGFIIFDI